MQNLGMIAEYIGEPEMLAQLAEEAAELSQAALKLRRSIMGVNPTPKSEQACRGALLEEMADVELCLGELGLMDDRITERVLETIGWKRNRWVERLVNNPEHPLARRCRDER